MAAGNSASLEHTVSWTADHLEADLRRTYAVALQRRAMRSMLLAMLVMALGVPLHILALGAHDAHGAGWWAMLVVWSSAGLTLLTFWTARDLLREAWRTLRPVRLRAADLVVLGALAAFVASCPALAQPTAPMYFDASAMALAWLLAGRSQAAEIEQRFVVVLEQLSPLNLPHPGAEYRSCRISHEHTMTWLGLAMLGCAAAALGWHLWWTRDLAQSGLAALATIAAACPCTLGIATSSAYLVGAERAAAAGWLVPSGAALRQAADRPDLLAVPIGSAEPERLRMIARSVQRALRLNTLWAVGLNLALLPLALLGPLPALLPAATMMLARLLISVTNRRIAALPR
ncbi:MAG TPA: hypothetical protein VFZ66_19780 [Herpetosiphonaceae bacterium]